MKQNDCYQLGEVIKTHGLKGEVTIALDVDFPEQYTTLESVFLEQHGKLIPFFIDTIQINGSKALVKFEEIDSQDSARSLVKCPLYLPLSALPSLEEGQYYFHELVGCEVIENGVTLGLIKEIIDLSGNQLIVMESDGKEILIPMKDEILINVDIPSQKVTVQLPDGLMDLYND